VQVADRTRTHSAIQQVSRPLTEVEGITLLGILSQINLHEEELPLEQAQVVKYSRRLRRVSLQRFLTSKIVYEVDKVTTHDFVALYDNQLWLERKCLSDKDFSSKFGSSLEELSSILKEANLRQGLTPKTLLRLSQGIQLNLNGFIVPHRNYPDFKKRFSGLFSVRTLSPPSEANRNLPPKRIIGTGYRDKGTARDPAKDGSPSWQEVASRAGQLALALRRIRDAKNFKDIETAFKDFFELD